jgi:nicotinamide riboside transporter PnuC
MTRGEPHELFVTQAVKDNYATLLKTPTRRNWMIQLRDKLVTLVTSVVTIATLVSQVAAEAVKALTAWDGTWVNAGGLVIAVIAIIRMVTQVPKEERGL